VGWVQRRSDHQIFTTTTKSRQQHTVSSAVHTHTDSRALSSPCVRHANDVIDIRQHELKDFVDVNAVAGHKPNPTSPTTRAREKQSQICGRAFCYCFSRTSRHPQIQTASDPCKPPARQPSTTITT
jgi:hypothetical protein